jgi:uncharacterized repeat protein (TIGR02543 family)
MKKVRTRIAIIVILSILGSSLSACSTRSGAIDPGTWGYDSIITYNALGGTINARETRKTYYQPNSYIFKPSGSSNMLVEPVKDGYILAGWYTAKSPAPQGSAEEYLFSGTDRWDFNTDRMQGDMTLYARWIPRGKVNYFNAATGEVIFNKNITVDSPIQKLSDSVLELKKPKGTSLAGYYSDASCTQEYDFSSFTYVEPTPMEAELYAKLYEMFPKYLEYIEYKEPKEKEANSGTDTSWLFLNKLGYNLKSTDKAVLDQIRAAKDQLIESAIQTYLTNTANRAVYLKFTEGNYIKVRNPSDLKVGTKYGFFDQDLSDQPINGYIFEADIDLAGVSFTASDNFSGKIIGNGHTISNLQISVTSRKIDTDLEKFAGLAKHMEGAVISDLTFKDAKLTLQVNPGIRVTGGLLAASASGVTLNNCRFVGLTISSGKSDDGQTAYQLGDLFGSYDNCSFNNCSAEGLKASVKSPDKLTLALFKLPN